MFNKFNKKATASKGSPSKGGPGDKSEPAPADNQLAAEPDKMPAKPAPAPKS